MNNLENIIIEEENIKWFARRLLTWAERNLRDYPWRRTSDPYSILVAEFLLQRTDADTVVPIYEAFLTRYPTVEKLANADVEAIAKLLQPLGLFSEQKDYLKQPKLLERSTKEKYLKKKRIYSNFLALASTPQEQYFLKHSDAR